MVRLYAEAIIDIVEAIGSGRIFIEETALLLRRLTIMLLLALAFTLVLAVAHQLGHLSMTIVIGYGVMSTLTFILYAVDKRAAIIRERRIPELHLHLCALLGGWPGALLAQPLFRHKRRKMKFQIGFWGVTLLNAGVLMMWIIKG